MIQFIKAFIIFCFIFSIFVTESAGQYVWDKYDENPVIEINSQTWYEDFCHTKVIFDEDIFKLWFAGWTDDAWNIGYATSPDGINWDLFDGPVISAGGPDDWDRTKLPGTILRIDDTLRMWYYGGRGDHVSGSFGYAWSLDGISWHLREEPVFQKDTFGLWDGSWIYPPVIYYDGSKYYMYYGGQGDNYQIGMASSYDGFDWRRDYSVNPILQFGDSGSFYREYLVANSVVFYNDTLYLYFHGHDGYSSSNPLHFLRIGCAWSADFTHWTVGYLDERVLDVGFEGEWDYYGVRNATVLIHDNQFKMWFTGYSSHRKNFGYALGDKIPGLGISEDNNYLANSMTIHPNPFQSTTTIEYHLQRSGPVMHSVYDHLGVLIESFEEYKREGIHSREWCGSPYPAGVYYYVIEASGSMLVGKMVLID